MRPRRPSFNQLVNENKILLLKDEQLMLKIEQKIENKQLTKKEPKTTVLPN
ncbi:hypothetical protein HNQ94_003330 [Salirhabdus euzebyi]|uniref:FbpB family small basic protein n=1 Tax=Salirhabdus euzebyi TaxID=394506 RepID=A0A841Q8Q4_9BACI|nr:FbpB family small basic protein [Salirhabdus euzebyi]MBB6454841.1 hypothetical protein [Salirhabdus euzebyi]